MSDLLRLFKLVSGDTSGRAYGRERQSIWGYARVPMACSSFAPGAADVGAIDV